MRTCSVCDRKYWAKDYCRLHYERWKKTGMDPWQQLLWEYYG